MDYKYAARFWRIQMKDTLIQWASSYEHELYFKGFLERYSKWIENVESDSEKQILNKILLRMKFYSKPEIKSYLNSKLSGYKIRCSNFENTNILPMFSSNRRYNGSYDVLGQLIELDKELSMNGNQLLPYRDTVIMDVRDVTQDIETLIIVDDICGTGGTLKNFIRDNKSKMNGKKVIIIFLVVTEEAINEFGEIIKNNNDLDLTIDYCTQEEKLSKIGYLNTAELQKLEELEGTLWGSNNNYVYGFKRSELLVGFSHNIPNNTISSIWYREGLGVRKDWNPLFVRYTKKNKRRRKEQNYHVAKKGK